MTTRTLSAIAAALMMGSACAQTPTQEHVPSNDSKSTATGHKADHWGPADRPSLFSTGLEYRLSELPETGEAANIPWASSYWPVYQDSINFKWAGEDSMSTAAKYGEAFGVDGLEDKVSKHHGIDKFKSRTECETNDDCNDKIAEVCAKRDGADKGRCIPTWWGICHAWAPAAIVHPEPLRPVTRNGVTFEVNDIKSLLTLINDKADYRFVSLRCDGDDSEGDIEYDQWDRPTGSDIGCKDTNPGTYHILLANYLGLQGQSFVEDRTFDNEVWNQPLRGYRITEMVEVSAQQANQLIGMKPEGKFAPTLFEAEGEVAHEAWHHEAPYPVAEGQRVIVTMTGSGDADLHVKFGAQPAADVYDCRPYDSGSDERCELTVPAGVTEVFVSALGYAQEPSEFKLHTEVALTSEDPLAGIPTEYAFNDQAVSFRRVKLEVDYITESESTEPGNLAHRIDHFTRTDRYEYVLELDKDGKIHGGEWIGASKKDHPDFLWLPTGRYRTGGGNVAGGAIRKEMVLSLLDESMSPIETDPNIGPKVHHISETGAVSKGGWRHFGPFEVTGPNFSVTMEGSGDADLYVRRAQAPTASDFDCRPYDSGSAESCVTSGAGTYFVSVHGYTDAEFSLAMTWTEPGSGDEAPQPSADIAHLDETGELAKGEMRTFELDVLAGQLLEITTEAANDVDIYVRMNQVPTRAMYDQRAWTASGNETLRFMPNAAGKLFIAVDGYQASAFTLKTANP